MYMVRYRDITAWLLLVTFVAGGLLGPSLHRIHHAVEKAAEEPCHSEAIHNADTPLLGSDDDSVHASHCALCVTRLVVVLPALETLTVPTILGSPSVDVGVHLTPVHVFTHRTIRGPPPLS